MFIESEMPANHRIPFSCLQSFPSGCDSSRHQNLELHGHYFADITLQVTYLFRPTRFLSTSSGGERLVEGGWCMCGEQTRMRDTRLGQSDIQEPSCIQFPFFQEASRKQLAETYSSPLPLSLPQRRTHLFLNLVASQKNTFISKF